MHVKLNNFAGAPFGRPQAIMIITRTAQGGLYTYITISSAGAGQALLQLHIKKLHIMCSFFRYVLLCAGIKSIDLLKEILLYLKSIIGRDALAGLVNVAVFCAHLREMYLFRAFKSVLVWICKSLHN